VAYLLDVNVLIARTDPRHESHVALKAWLERIGTERLLFCPRVENGFLRIYGHPSYPRGPGSPAKAAVDLRDMLELPNAVFVPDDVSIRNTDLFVSTAGLTPRQLSDVYLLGLSVSKGTRFATLDGRIPASAVRGGRDAVTVIDQG
jgi:toxin-antitoxin system PIN domain toxin